MEAPKLQHRIKIPLHGHTITMEILAYRKLFEDEIDSCVKEYVRSLKKRRLKTDTKVRIQTIIGATDSI